MAEAYKIGVTVAMTNLLSGELGKIGQQLIGVHSEAKGLNLTLSQLGRIGLAASVVAVGAALAAGVEEARKFQKEATKFETLGFGDAINMQAQQFARGLKTMGTSATENMELVTDAMAVFKDLGHAEMVTPLLSKMKFANAALYGEEGGGRTSKFMDMLKVVEMRGGLSSDAEFATQADFVQKVINGSRGRVDATSLLQALKTGGVSMSRLSNEAFYLGSEPLIQEFGGQRYGTANMSIYQNLVQMRTTQQALSELMRLGLLDPSKVEMNKFTGKVKRAQPGAFRGADVLTSEGDLAFLEKVLLPAFRSHGVTSDQDTIMEIGRILTNRTGSALLSRAYQQRATLATQSEANKHALGIDGTAAAADKTLDGKIAELSAEWKKLELQMGVLLPAVIKFVGLLTRITKALQLDSTFSNRVGSFINGQLAEDKAEINSIGRGWHSVKSALGFGDVGSPPSATKITGGTTIVQIDGKEVGRAATKYQVGGMSTAAAGPSFFDGKASPIPVH